MTVICALLIAYLLVLLVRAIGSWFPAPQGGLWATIYRVALDLTEPVLAPMRRVIPPAGMFDLSFLVLFLVLIFIYRTLCG